MRCRASETRNRTRRSVTDAFGEVAEFQAERVPLVRDQTRLIYTCRLMGFKGVEGGTSK